MIKHKLKSILSLALLLSVTACGNSHTTQQADNVSKQTSSGSADAAVPTKTVLVFGDSLTAGYGLDDPEDDAYPSVLQDKIKDAKLPYTVINAGNSGETSAGGRNRIDWVLRQKVDVFVLELGANDGLRGVPVTETRRNLQAIIDRVKAKYPDAKLVLCGMQIPPSMGKAYTADFKALFPELAKKNNMTLVPFLLDHVGGIPKLNQADGIHPTKEGAKIVADNVWAVLQDVLENSKG
ncbi:arylesterase [Mucilaginibacter lacusdianchii]|uniref:arylesterase n=1 Tax=Mucilaginibacter lacusdianchii TaxID=2684211 RepID=UPI00131E0A04|nr:arylesterase [Mucilaginibacter sp. JXJ CY 39]